MAAPKIGIFGHYGNKNLGDEAIIEAAIQNLREAIPEVRLVGLSINPFDTQSRHDIESFPIRFRKDFFAGENNPPSPSTPSSLAETICLQPKPSLKDKLKSFWLIRKAFSAIWHLRETGKKILAEISFLKLCKQQLIDMDLLIICGSNQFLDNFGGPWGFPYTILKWTLLAKQTQTKVAFVSVGAGPLSKRLSFWMLKIALRRADYLSYRDEGSKAMVEERISKIDGLIYPDVAHSLKTQPVRAGSALHDTKPVISINPMPVFDKRYWYTSKPEKYLHYVECLVNLIRHIQTRAYRVNLFNTQSKDLDVIEDIIDKFSENLPEGVPHNIEVSNSESVDQLINVLGLADLVIATRFHATVLPLRLGKPVFGICYYRKSKELLDDVGLESCSVDINDFSFEELRDKLDKMLDNLEGAKESIQSRYGIYKTTTNEQWSAVVSLVHPPKRA